MEHVFIRPLPRPGKARPRAPARGVPGFTPHRVEEAAASAALRVLLLGLVLGLCNLAAAVDVVPFDAALPAKSRCRVPIEQLRPTQFCVGYWEIDRRAESIVHKSPRKLNAYLEEHLAEIVIGPGGLPYLIDGHHISLILLKTHLSDTVEAKVRANWRDLQRGEFWERMKQHGWLYLYDNQGHGPLDPAKLPKKVTEMTDDPYRSLSWAVRKRAGFEKVPNSYSEFQWANFFRQRVPLGKGEDGFQQAIETARRLSHSPEAKDLPGYEPH